MVSRLQYPPVFERIDVRISQSTSECHMAGDPVMLTRSFRSLLNIIERFGSRVRINLGPMFVELRAESVVDPTSQESVRVEGPPTPERDYQAACELARKVGIDEEVLLLHSAVDAEVVVSESAGRSPALREDGRSSA